ncbi:MAG: hypothetical protein GX547_14485 [Phycisphaerae bacterium]|nr:hypothetical protein [Phycisphaerae bacterium]
MCRGGVFGLLCMSALALLAPVFACLGSDWQPNVWAGDAEEGLVYMLPGIDGQPGSLLEAYAGLRDGGVEAEIRVFNWGPYAMLNLTYYERNRKVARAIADEIVAFQDQYSDAPVDLVGYSGGGALVLLVLESLPAERSVRKAVIVQAGVSPDYDLSEALWHVEDQLVSFYCPSDWLVLGVLTELVGTVDRAHTVSAGKDGFDTQRAIPDPLLADKLAQICWTPDMRSAGHQGDHDGMFEYDWNRRYVAPHLVPRQ